MLHIVTPIFRFENLEKIWFSIPMNEDITWHICKSNQREEINYDFIKSDKRIKIHNIDCDDRDVTKKRNYAFSKIKNGYFCLLDDDTLFHENMYEKYVECQEHGFRGVLIGEQLDNKGKLRLIASKPVFERIDTGNALAHHSCLNEVEWPHTHNKGINQKDYLFWNSVYEFYGKKCAIWNSPISHYNKLNDEINRQNY